jgi:hypothetical protein
MSERDVLSRRALFGRALAGIGAGVGAVATGLGAWRFAGYFVDPSRATRLQVLDAWELCVVDALGDRLCALDVAEDSIGAPPTAREVDVGLFFDGYLAGAASDVQRDLRGALALVEHLWPLRCGARHRFTSLVASEQDRTLAALERAPVELLRGCFFGLKSVVMMGYWRDPRTWGVLGYDGPLVARPSEGWTPPRYRPRLIDGDHDG